MNKIPSQDKRVFIITGANSGLGYETSKFLLEKGATVIMCCRDSIKGEKAKNELGWKPTITLENMIKEMVKHDRKEARKELENHN